MRKRSVPFLSRREATQGILLAFGGLFGGVATFVVNGCSSGAAAGSGSSTSGGGAPTDAASTTDSGDSGGSSMAWASGGTASMTAKAS